MSLPSFQRAFYDLIANPALCMEAKQNPQLLSEKYDLTEKESKRLNAVIWQKGMSTNCTLYRVNRVTPIYTLMPYTCKLLGEAILPVLNEFWSNYAKTKLQYKDEVALFSNFLQLKITSGELDIQYLEDILNFESNVNAIRYQEPPILQTKETQHLFRLHPQVRVVEFQHDPTILIGELVSNEPADMSKIIPTGRYYILLKLRDEEMEMNLITDVLAGILNNIEHYQDLPADLIERGYVVESNFGNT